jgi:hypothetical protein
MGKFKQEIVALIASASQMDDETFNQKVLASVAAHLAETTQQEESYYTHLAKFELTVMPKILQTPTVISSFLGSDVDPLQEVREKTNVLQQTLSKSLEACVIEIKNKMEKQAVSLEKIAKEHEETIEEHDKDGSSIETNDRLSAETLSALQASAKIFRENAAETRKQAIAYDGYKTELDSFLKTPTNVLSTEAAKLLGQVRRFVSTREGLPKLFADWNEMTTEALSAPKTNSTVVAVIRMLLKAINSYQAPTEKMMRHIMVERTTVDDAQKMMSHISQQASNVNSKALSAQEELVKAQKDAREAAERLKAAEENLKKQEQQAALAQRVTTEGKGKSGNSVASFATFRTRNSNRFKLGLPQTNPTADGDKMLAIGAWTETQVKLLSYLGPAYELEVSNEAEGKTTYAPETEIQNGVNGTNGIHKSFVKKEIPMSVKYFSFIEALADETSTPEEVLKTLTQYYPTHYVTRQLGEIRHLSWYKNRKEIPKLKGFAVSTEATQEEIVAKYKKIAMLANMWGDADETSILPQNIKKSDVYIENALDMESKYAFIEPIKEGRLNMRRKEIEAKNNENKL